jgi:hypothetical protein
MATTSEKLEDLRKELHAYHMEVREHIAEFRACDGAVQVLQADVYGIAGERGDHPGVIGEVASLKRSRRNLWIALRCAWGLLIAGAGYLASAIFE